MTPPRAKKIVQQSPGLESVRNLPVLARRIRPLSEELAAAREDARTLAVAAIRRLEAILQEALAGERLRGLKDISPAPGCHCFAARITGQMDAELPRDGRAVKVLAHDGTFCAASCDWKPTPRIVCVSVLEADILAEDLEDFALVAERVLLRHLDLVREASDRYAAARVLAKALEKALDGA